MSANSYDARATLEVGDRSFEIFRLDALQSKFDVARLPFSLKVLLENLLRNEDGVAVSAQDIEALATWDASDEPSKEIAFTPARVLMQDFTGVPAVVDLAAMRDAMADMGGDPVEDQPARARRARHRPLRAGRRLRHARRLPAQRRARVRAQQGALRLPALGPGRLRRLRGRAARHRHRPPGQPRVPRARRLPQREDRPGLPRHARRHRLAHDDDQRPGRPRLGRRRHRGRGRDARPAHVDAHPAGARLQAVGRAARGRDRHRPRAHRHRDAAPARAWSASSSSSTAPASPTCRSPTARRSATCRRSSARPARSSRSTPRRCATCGSRGAPTSRSRSSRPTPRSRASGTTRAPRSRPTPTPSSSTSRTSCRASPGPKRPQDRVSLSDAKEAFLEALHAYVPNDSHLSAHDKDVADTFPASDPPADTAPGSDGGPAHDEMDGAELDEAVEAGAAAVAVTESPPAP